MRLSSIEMTDFKRFTSLKVQNLPKTAKLIVLVGPNGSGKSSFFDGLHLWHRTVWRRNSNWNEDYYKKSRGSGRRWDNDVAVEFHEGVPSSDLAKKKALRLRSAYRNEPDFTLSKLARQQSLVDELRLNRMTDTEASVSKNYARLASQAMKDVFEQENPNTTIEQFREKTIGQLRAALKKLFPDLELNSLGNPLTEGTFRFTKGVTSGFGYGKLSGGEKAAFDLLLDFFVTTNEFDDTVFCIDEPETHLHARLQSKLLEVLLDMLPDKCQLLIATHSIGIVRKARDLQISNPDEIVFLDLGNRDFDVPQVIEPAIPTRQFWQDMYEVALADLAALVAPRRVVICEGDPQSHQPGKNVENDARCFTKIFETEFPETKFVGGGNAADIGNDRLALATTIDLLIDGIEVVRVIDRDDKSDQEVQDAAKDGLKILGRRNLESYLFDDDVLKELCISSGNDEKIESVLAEKAHLLNESSGAADDLKPISGQLYVFCKKELALTQCGGDTKAFMRDTLSGLISNEIGLYQELKTAMAL